MTGNLVVYLDMSISDTIQSGTNRQISPGWTYQGAWRRPLHGRRNVAPILERNRPLFEEVCLRLSQDFRLRGGGRGLGGVCPLGLGGSQGAAVIMHPSWTVGTWYGRCWGISFVGAKAQPGDDLSVLLTTEQVTGVEVALPQRLVRHLGKLPVMEPGAQSAGDTLVAQCTIIVAQTVVGKAQGLREQPALASVLGEEFADPIITVAGRFVNLGFQVSKRNEREDGVAKFGIQLPVQTPEALGIQLPARDFS